MFYSKFVRIVIVTSQTSKRRTNQYPPSSNARQRTRCPKAEPFQQKPKVWPPYGVLLGTQVLFSTSSSHKCTQMLKHWHLSVSTCTQVLKY